MRTIARLPGALMLLDIANDGRVLLVRASWRRELIGFGADGKQRELSWLDYTYPAELSPDGKTLLFDEEGGGGSLAYSKSGGYTYGVYVRKTDGSPAVLLGEGSALGLVARRKMGDHPNPGLARPAQTPAHRRRPGQGSHQRQHQPQLGSLVPRRQTHPVFRQRTRTREKSSTSTIWTSGKSQAITPEGVNGNSFAISPDSQSVAAIGPDQRSYLYPVNGGDPRLDPRRNQGEQPITWSADGHSLYVYQPGELPAHVYRVDVQSGKRTLWKDLMPTDPAGVENIGPILMTPDAKTCVFGYHRNLADLYLVEGLK